MPPVLEQTAANSIRKDGDGWWGYSSCRVTLSRATRPGSLVIVSCLTTGGLELGHSLDLSGYTLLRSYAARDIQLTVWYRANAPSITQATVSVGAYRAMQVRVMEYSGVAQANPLDKFVLGYDNHDHVTTSNTGTLTATGELAVGITANQYASTYQYGFAGGLSKFAETVSPSSYQQDWERGRVAYHQAVLNSTSSRNLTVFLSSERRTIVFLMVFKSGASGPANLNSTGTTGTINPGGRGSLTVFGPLKSIAPPPMLGEVSSSIARIGPFNYQYRLGGWQGLLIGTGTPYRVESIEGLEGWEVRVTDEDIPRGDGALRGIDLQTARQMVFKVNFDGNRNEIEEAQDNLYRTLVHQRDSDWELIYRHPGRPLRMLRCRPIEVTREMNLEQLLVMNQMFVLRAADPRHYSVEERSVSIPISPSNDNPIQTAVANAGNSYAYPEIVVTVANTSATVTKIELVNSVNGDVFDFRAVMPARSQLTADMQARATGAPVSAIAVDGQSKYGGWQLPRKTFALNPGLNQVYLLVEPSYAVVTCSLRYRDTWSG